ncbi:UV damage endonuclease UvsE [Candidatus Oscillochloris fontis]|uniref:UV damage endonuclease UvsE n=1 Tax=Candidatus Oscillochloris fontis TaxID=2496868 RepID=UPI00101C5E18|nr:UV damage endonuclease UvsE [Candidatus Oscillochloris fontis]
MPTPPHIRLGFAVRVVGRPGLGAGGPAHLSLALVRLGDVLGYLERIGVQFYRIRPDLLAPQALDQLDACAAQLDLLAARLARTDIRLTSHMDHGVALGAADANHVTANLAAIEATAALLERLDAHRPAGGIEGTLVVHVGAAHADPASLDRFAARFAMLSPRAQSRLAVEHDSAGFSLGQLLILHQRCGIPLVFDLLHWEIFNPEAIPLSLALGLALATWPASTRPEVHLSSPRSEAHLLPAHANHPGRVLPPRPGQHADFIEAAALQRLLEAARGLPAFDLMLEAKAGDLALLRLRNDIAHRAPALAYGVQ